MTRTMTRLVIPLLLSCYQKLLHAVPAPVSLSLVQPSQLSAQVNTLDSQTARVSWTLDPRERNRAVEIVYSPAGASYFIVQPVLNPVSQFQLLENLLPFTEYQLVVRTINSSFNIDNVNENIFKHSSALYFNTAIVTDGNSPIQHASALNLVEVALVILMLLLWVVVIRIFLQRWGKNV